MPPLFCRMPVSMKTKNEAVLNRNVQFQNVYRGGKSYVSPLVVTYILSRRKGRIRYGITASRKIGCAAERNRARRVIKAAALKLLPMANGAYDIVFVARATTAGAKSTAVYEILYGQLRKAGVIADEASFLS